MSTKSLGHESRRSLGRSATIRTSAREICCGSGTSESLADVERMQPTSEIRTLLACYERTIVANEKAGVTSRMFLNNIAKQPSSRNLKAPSRAASCRNPRSAESSSSKPPARVTPLLNSAGQSSRFQLTRSSSARTLRPGSSRDSTEGSPSALEHQLRKHGSSALTRAGKSDGTISTAGSTFVEDADDAIRLFLHDSLDLDEGSDDDQKRSSFSPFKKRESSSSTTAFTVRQNLVAGLDAEATNIPLSLRSFHRSSSSRSLRSNEDEDSTGFKLITHREIGGVDNDATTATVEDGATNVLKLRQRFSGRAAPRDPTPVRQNSSRTLLSTTSNDETDKNELDVASCHSAHGSSRKTHDGRRSSPNKDRSATSSSVSGLRHSKASSTRKLEGVDDRSNRGEGDDLDATSCHSLTVRTSVRRSKPTSPTRSSEDRDCEKVQKKKRSTSSTNQSLSTSRTCPTNETGKKATNDGASTTSPKLKSTRRKTAASPGGSSTRSTDDASVHGESGRTADEKKRRDRKAEKSQVADRVTTIRPSRSQPRIAAKHEASPTSTTASHNGSWTLSFDDDDDDGIGIDLSPGKLGRSAKWVAGPVAPETPPLSTKSRPTTSSTVKDSESRKTSPPKKSSSRSSAETTRTRSSIKGTTKKSKVATTTTTSRVRKKIVAVHPSSSPPSPAHEETPKKLPTSLERRRQRHLERTQPSISSDL